MKLAGPGYGIDHVYQALAFFRREEIADGVDVGLVGRDPVSLRIGIETFANSGADALQSILIGNGGGLGSHAGRVAIASSATRRDLPVCTRPVGRGETFRGNGP